MTSLKYTLNKYDWFSTFRNWAILNGAMLLADWNSVTTMLVNWDFNCVKLREIAVLSISSLLLFMIKRFFMGEKIDNKTK